MNSAANLTIARRFLPSRSHYYYTRSKLSSDPLYAVASQLLANTRWPLLDFGCGIGLLVHCLRASGIGVKYVGVDCDARKIESARNAAARSQLADVHFHLADLNRELPTLIGNVSLLD